MSLTSKRKMTEKNLAVHRRMDDSSLRQLWRLTNIRVKVRKRALTLTDGKD
jgi:hypothetical protein